MSANKLRGHPVLGPNKPARSTADDRAQTHAEHVIEDSAELSTHKSPSIAEGGALTTVVQEQIS